MKVLSNDIARLELTEARAWSDLYTATDTGVRAPLNAAAYNVGSATAVMAGAVDILACNRVIGAGLDGEIEDDVIATTVAAYRACGVARFFVQVAPHVAAGITGSLEAHGFRHYNDWVKLFRGVGPMADVSTTLAVERIDERCAEEFADIFVTSFEWPRALVPWLADLVGRPRWYHYLATDAGRGVATAAMRVEGDVAWIDFASTLPSQRGLGAQSALLHRRVGDCAELGVRTIVVEAGDGGGSMRNLERAGFTRAYLRANYLLETG